MTFYLCDNWSSLIRMATGLRLGPGRTTWLLPCTRNRCPMGSRRRLRIRLRNGRLRSTLLRMRPLVCIRSPCESYLLRLRDRTCQRYSCCNRRRAGRLRLRNLPARRREGRTCRRVGLWRLRRWLGTVFSGMRSRFIRSRKYRMGRPWLSNQGNLSMAVLCLVHRRN